MAVVTVYGFRWKVIHPAEEWPVKSRSELGLKCCCPHRLLGLSVPWGPPPGDPWTWALTPRGCQSLVRAWVNTHLPGFPWPPSHSPYGSPSLGLPVSRRVLGPATSSLGIRSPLSLSWVWMMWAESRDLLHHSLQGPEKPWHLHQEELTKNQAIFKGQQLNWFRWGWWWLSFASTLGKPLRWCKRLEEKPDQFHTAFKVDLILQPPKGRST